MEVTLGEQGVVRTLRESLAGEGGIGGGGGQGSHLGGST